MIHTALARKYRPNRFADLVGQEHVAAGLIGAVAKNHVAHAYLLTGPRGVGKTSAARILAMALNCASRTESTGEPCAECDSCRSIWLGNADLDVVEIDAASNRGVDDARDLRERAMYAASAADRHKVYIVDEAHMLTREAWNALLKILEEPPPRVVFVFATTEPQKITNTAAPVMSRLQRFDFKRLGPTAIASRLRYVAEAEGLQASDDAIELLARAAEGGMRDALSALDQVVVFGDGSVTLEMARQALGLISDELYHELLDIVVNRRSGDVFPFVERLVESGADLAEFIKGAGELLRSLLNALLGGEPEVFKQAIAEVVETGDASPGDVLRMVRLLADAETNIRRSVFSRLQVEALLLQWTLLDRTVDLEELLGCVAAGTGGPVTPATGKPARKKVTAGARREKPAPLPEAPPPAPPRDPDTLSLAELKQAWGRVVESVGSTSMMLKEAMIHAEPRAVTAGKVMLSVTDSGVHMEGLKRGAKSIAAAIERATGAAVTVGLEEAESEAGNPAPTPPARLDETADKQERMRSYRSKDEALDAAAETLDLELTD